MSVRSTSPPIFDIRLVVDARHLLLPRGHDPYLARGRSRGILDEPGIGQARLGQRSPQPLARLVVADDPDEHGRRAERAHVVRDVGRAAQPILVAHVLDDRHRRLRRDALHAPDDELVEHQIADDNDTATGETRNDGGERVVGRGHASAPSGLRSDA